MNDSFESRLVDATPPADFPDQVIIVDHQNPKAPYYLRVKKGERDVDLVELEDANGAACSLVAAVMCATREGYHPTHYVDGNSGPWLIPTGIVRRPASAPQKR